MQQRIGWLGLLSFVLLSGCAGDKSAEMERYLREVAQTYASQSPTEAGAWCADVAGPPPLKGDCTVRLESGRVAAYFDGAAGEYTLIDGRFGKGTPGVQ